MRQIIQKSKCLIIKNGLLYFFKKVLMTIVKKIIKINLLVIFELNIEKQIPQISACLDLTFKKAGKDDIKLLEKKAFDYTANGVEYSKNRLDNGDICALALLDNKIIGYISFMNSSMELSQGNYISLSLNRSYLYHAFVKKEFRGKRVLNGLIMNKIDILRSQGKRYFVIKIAYDNEPSIKAIERMGFFRIGKVVQLRALGFIKYDYISKNDLLYLQAE